MEDMKEYVFERDMFANIFNSIIGTGSKEFNVLDDARYNFTSIGDFRIWTEEEEIYILHLPSGTLLGWYKFYHIGRCNFCSRSDMSESELKEFFQLLKEQLGNEPDSKVYQPNISITEIDKSEYKSRSDIGRLNNVKTYEVVDMINLFGENATLKQVFSIVSDGRKYRCPKCDGKGKITVEYNGYPKGLPDSGFVYEAAFKDIECDLCKGEGYTREEYKPRYIQDGFEVVTENGGKDKQ